MHLSPLACRNTRRVPRRPELHLRRPAEATVVAADTAIISLATLTQHACLLHGFKPCRRAESSCYGALATVISFQSTCGRTRNIYVSRKEHGLFRLRRQVSREASEEESSAREKVPETQDSGTKRFTSAYVWAPLRESKQVYSESTRWRACFGFFGRSFAGGVTLEQSRAHRTSTPQPILPSARPRHTSHTSPGLWVRRHRHVAHDARCINHSFLSACA